VNVHPNQLCSLASQSGVERLARLIKEGGWSDNAGSLMVRPAASDKKQFADCLWHFNAMHAVQKQLYSDVRGSGEHSVCTKTILHVAWLNQFTFVL
jgi:hypothetical protein